MISKSARGYTLVDMIVCVAFVAMLVAIAIPKYLQKRTAAEFAQARADMQNIKLGLEAYRVDRMDYPWMNTVNSALGGGEGLFAWSLPTLERLTTPVAYVSGSPFFDPFQATHCYYGSDLESVRDTTSAQYLADAFKQYFYNTRNALDSSMMGQLNEQKPLWFLLEAAGPDKHHHTMWQALNGASSNTDEKIAMRSKAIYDPTNGSVSRGSIWEVGGEPQGAGSTFATAVENANSSRISGWQEYVK